MSTAVGTGNTAPVLTTITIMMFIWALIAYAIRLYVKIHKSTGWSGDDTAMSGAILASLAQLVCVCYAIPQGYGSEWHVLDDREKVRIQQCLYASQIFYVLCVGCTKLSAGIFVSNVLTRDAKRTRIAQAITTLYLAWTVCSVVVISFRGKLTEPWNAMDGSKPVYIRWLAIDSSGIVLDLLGAIVVSILVSALHMTLFKKIMVCVTLSCRLVLTIPIAFRLYYLAPHNFDSRNHPEDLITQSILCFAIVLASVTCLKPVLKPFDQATFGSYATSTAISKYTLERDATKSACYELSDADPRNRPGPDPQVSRASRPEPTKQRKYVIEEDEIPLNDELQVRSHRGDTIGYGSHIVSQNESEDNSGNGIRKDISWSVRTFEEEDGVGTRADQNAISPYRI